MSVLESIEHFMDRNTVQEIIDTQANPQTKYDAAKQNNTTIISHTMMGGSSAAVGRKKGKDILGEMVNRDE